MQMNARQRARDVNFFKMKSLMAKSDIRLFGPWLILLEVYDMVAQAWHGDQLGLLCWLGLKCRVLKPRKKGHKN